MSLNTNNAILSNAITVDSSYRVGIGTSSPSYMLDVNGTSRFGSDTINGNMQIISNSQPLIIRGRSPYSSAGLLLTWDISPDTGVIAAPNLTFNTNATIGTNAGSERMRITSTGLVGIGTSTPASQLTIVGNDPSQVSVEASSGNINAQINLKPSGSGIAYIKNQINTDFALGTNNTERMRITSGGQVIIGSTASLYPSVKLSIKQTSANIPAEIWSNYSGDSGSAAVMLIKYDNSSSSSQVFQRFVIDNGNTACGQINGNGASQVAFGSWSDLRLKDNIENLPSQLSNIMALRPVEFDYKNGSGHQIGFIAQEMKEVYPDSVGEDSDGFLTITGWSKTEARLVKAIQELEARIKTLENK